MRAEKTEILNREKNRLATGMVDDEWIKNSATPNSIDFLWRREKNYSSCVRILYR